MPKLIEVECGNSECKTKKFRIEVRINHPINDIIRSIRGANVKSKIKDNLKGEIENEYIIEHCPSNHKNKYYIDELVNQE